MGQKIVLTDTTFTGSGLPSLRDDALLSSGSLILFDPAHSTGAFTGIPSAASALPNVAWKEAAAVIGSGTQSTLGLLVESARENEATKMITERTLKGGVHGISALSGTQAASTSYYWAAKAGNAIRDYMYANRLTNRFYVSMWSKPTRLGTATSVVQPTMMWTTDGTGSTHSFYFVGGLASGNQGDALNSPTTNDVNIATIPGTARFASCSVLGVYGTGPNATVAVMGGVGTWGAWSFANTNRASSSILYRMYVEDLTVSGRTVAEVQALDYAMWQAAFAVGGKFYGDTYTAPSTLP